MPRKRISKKWIALVVLALVVFAAGAYAFTKRHDIKRATERAALPEPVPYQATEKLVTPSTAAARATATPRAAAANQPAEVNLAVPFTPQAPFGKWEPPYKELCEEASVLMAASFIRHETIASPTDADKKMLAIKAFEDERFGYYEDTTAAETLVILHDHYKIKNAALLENPSVADLKSALAAGKLIIMPAAGRLLGNPYYTPPGPLYHMLVIKGYTSDGKFITNDPGTRRGADFLYSPETIMNALHDWRADGQVELGRKVVIIVG